MKRTVRLKVISGPVDLRYGGIPSRLVTRVGEDSGLWFEVYRNGRWQVRVGAKFDQFMKSQIIGDREQILEMGYSEEEVSEIGTTSVEPDRPPVFVDRYLADDEIGDWEKLLEMGYPETEVDEMVRSHSAPDQSRVSQAETSEDDN